MYICLHVKYPFSRPSLMKLEFSHRIFEKSANIKFRENQSGGSRAVPCGRTDMTKLIFAFRNIANAPKDGALINQRNVQATETINSGAKLN
jgi:hypothetical protein